jgi:ATP-dependent DNA helicase RecG
MAVTPLMQMIAAGESQRVEFKTSGADTDAVAKEVCAFLNSDGGTLIVGVSDNGKVVGVEDAPQAAESIQQHLLDGISPKASWSVNVATTDGKEVIVIDVPRGHESPYVYGSGIFVRSGTQSVFATSEVINRLISRRGAEEIRWERLPALGVEVDELDKDEIRRTASEAISGRLYSFSNVDDSFSILEELGLAEDGLIRNGAVVLFGKHPERRFPQVRAKAARFKGKSVLEPFADNRTFEGHAFNIVDKLESFLRTHIPISSELPSQGTRRSDKPAYPWTALREALLNAIVHRDYAAFDGGLSLAVYDDRIEFWNSGKLPEGMTVEDLKQPHPSRPHNPDIANVFFLRGFIERWGIGTRQIVNRCLEVGLPEPEWKEGYGGGVTLIIRLKPKAREIELNPRQVRLLRELEPGEKIEPGEYFSSVKNEVKERRARKDLTELFEAGYFTREGQGPSTVYIRTDKNLP